jgi:hypothetical protein
MFIVVYCRPEVSKSKTSSKQSSIFSAHSILPVSVKALNMLYAHQKLIPQVDSTKYLRLKMIKPLIANTHSR